MKYSSFKTALFLCLFTAVAPSFINAQTVLVHTSVPSEQNSVNLKLYSQSAEAGIMDVLFSRGCIAFSDMSASNDSAVRDLALKTGSDYILKWSLIELGLKGQLLSTLKDNHSEMILVGETELDGMFTDPSELYSALGSRLCESLVGDRW